MKAVQCGPPLLPPAMAPAAPKENSPFQSSNEDHVTVIDLYTWSTPNGRKVSIALEEFGLEYETHPINIGADEQFHPDFLKISPNNKIPAIVDRDNGMSLMESGEDGEIHAGQRNGTLAGAGQRNGTLAGSG